MLLVGRLEVPTQSDQPKSGVPNVECSIDLAYKSTSVEPVGVLLAHILLTYSSCVP